MREEARKESADFELLDVTDKEDKRFRYLILEKKPEGKRATTFVLLCWE